MTRPSLGAYEWHLQPEPTPPPKLNRLYEKRAVAVEWESVDFPGGTVKVIVGDQTGKQLTSFLTVNDGSAFTTYPLRFTGTRQYRVASLDGTVVSDPETIELA